MIRFFILTQDYEIIEHSLESNTPRLIDTEGELLTTFEFDGQEVDRSCGVTYQNKHLIFGGNVNKRQILQVDECGLIKLGSLPFDHRLGACCSTEDVMILCFNYNDENDLKKCRQASSPTGSWSELALSSFEHRDTAIAASPGN